MFVLIGILPFVLQVLITWCCSEDGKLVDFIQCLYLRNSQYFFCVCNLFLYTYLPSFFVHYGWLYSENQCLLYEIERASIFSVFAIWFCIYTCLRSLCSMAGCIQNHHTDGQTEMSSTD